MTINKITKEKEDYIQFKDGFSKDMAPIVVAEWLRDFCAAQNGNCEEDCILLNEDNHDCSLVGAPNEWEIVE